jgi:hypothetical protein
MRKVLVMLLYLVTGFDFTGAQDLSFGARAGMNCFIARQGNYVPAPGLVFSQSWTWKSGYELGGYARWMINRRVGVQPELFYSFAGANGTQTQTIYPQDYSAPTYIYRGSSFSANYLSVPLLFRYSILNKVHLLLGPQLRRLLKLQYTLDGYGKQDVTSDFKPIELGLVVGFGYNLSRFNLSVRYYQSYNNVLNSARAYTPLPNAFYNYSYLKYESFQLTVGYGLWSTKVKLN